ncbi:hypothetical protein ACJJTC_016607 [Scirpophaga incertulas]
MMESKMNTNLEDLERLFSSRMAEYDERLQKATASVSSQAQSSPVDLSTLAREFSEFKTFIWQVLDKFKSQMKLLSVGYDRHETAMRRKVLLLHGIPEVLNENLFDTVHQIAHATKIETREELQELITKFPSTGNSSTDKRVVQAPRSSQRNIAPEPSNNPKAAKRTRSKVRK